MYTSGLDSSLLHCRETRNPLLPPCATEVHVVLDFLKTDDCGRLIKKKTKTKRQFSIFVWIFKYVYITCVFLNNYLWGKDI